MSTVPTSRTTRRPSRAVFAGTALGALLLVGGAGIGCAGGNGHGIAVPPKTVTKSHAPKHHSQRGTKAHTTKHASGNGGQGSAPTSTPTSAPTSAPTSNPASVTNGSGPVGSQGASSARRSSPAPQVNGGSGGTVDPSNTYDPSTSDPSTYGNGGSDPSATYGSGGSDPSTYGSGGSDPSTYGASGYTSPDLSTQADNGTTADTTPQSDMGAYHAYDQQSWDAWKASSDAANAGDPAAAYDYNQQSLNATANANDAYAGTSGTSAATGTVDTPSGE